MAGYPKLFVLLCTVIAFVSAKGEFYFKKEFFFVLFSVVNIYWTHFHKSFGGNTSLPILSAIVNVEFSIVNPIQISSLYHQ